MSVRKLMAGAAAGALVATTWSLAVPAPAQAEPSFVPDANDIVGVGSDTTQHAMHFIAEGVDVNGVHYPGYNELFAPDPEDARLVSYDAFGERVQDACPEVPASSRPAHPVAGQTVPCLNLRAGSPDLWRPNGSGNGKRALYQAMTGPNGTSVGDADGNPEVNFARSSAPVSGTAEINANIWGFPFAFDGFKPGVRAAGSNAPATITAQQFLDIYKGTVTDWSQIGGQPGTIVPLVPQPGSGTYQVFNTNMTTLNGGDANWATNPNIVTAQEHDPTLVQDNPNAVAPFSTGRAKAFATSVKILNGGWSVDRALFNMVRNADLDAPWVDTLFSDAGFLCSAAAQPLIEASGFEQLATPANGGICGEPTQGTPSNFTTSPDRVTVTELEAVSPAAGAVELTAIINEGKPAVEGTVTFTDADTGATVGTDTVSARVAELDLAGVTPGPHSYTATFVPEDTSAFSSSESAAVEVLVKRASTTALTVPAAGSYGRARAIGVKVMDGAEAATGSVQIKVGSLTRTVALSSAGLASLALPATQPVGRYPVSATYVGTSATARSAATGVVTITKAATTTREAFAGVVRAAKVRGRLAVSIVGSALKPAGKVTVLKGSRKVAAGTLRGGTATLTLAGLTKGRNTFTAVFAGDRNVGRSTVRIVVVRR